MGALVKSSVFRITPLAVLVALLSAPAAGDLFVLRDGGQIEGELLSRDENLVRIQTRDALVALRADEVVRIEQSQSSLKLYERLAREFPDTAEGHYRLGLWCRQRELSDLAEIEFRKALAIDPDHAAARGALGHVRVGDVWLDPAPPAVSVAQPAEPAGANTPNIQADGGSAQGSPVAVQPPADPQRALALARASLHDADREMMRTLRAEWVRRLQTIQTQYLSSSLRRQFNQGAEQVLAIRDPLAVEPMLQVLGQAGREQRRLLMTALGQFHSSAATMGLLEAAVIDEDGEVRKTALSQLQHRQDPRIEPFLLKALTSEDYEVMVNAATALGHLRIVSAIPALVKELTAKETRRVQTDNVVRMMRQTFVDESGQQRTIMIRRRFDPFAATTRLITVTTYRTAVQEALIAITDENYGFDAEAWMNWYRRHVAGDPQRR